MIGFQTWSVAEWEGIEKTGPVTVDTIHQVLVLIRPHCLSFQSSSFEGQRERFRHQSSLAYFKLTKSSFTNILSYLVPGQPNIYGIQ